MIYRHFRFHCILRVLLLGATIGLLTYLASRTTLYVTIVIVAALVMYQVYDLIHYVEKTKRSACWRSRATAPSISSTTPPSGCCACLI